MTVENQTNKKRVQGDGTTDTVTFNFKAISESDIKVYVYPDDLAFDDLEDYLLTGGGVDYDITLDSDGEGGEIVFTTAPASDEIALIINELDFTQTADLPTEGNFNETSVETALDRLVMQNIQQQERIVRGLSLRKEDPLAVDGLEGIFIAAEEAADRASRVLAWNSDGDGVESFLLTTDLEDLNAIADDISTVAGIAANVTTVAGIAANVTTVAGISASVATVAGISAAVTTVAGISANVTTVAGISANVTTVAGISTAVSTVAGISAAVSTVSGIQADVTTVAGISADVTTVAGIAAAVSAVAAIDTEVTTVAGIDTEITTVAGIAADVSAVSAIAAAVSSVAAIDSDVTAVAGIVADVTTVANNIASVVSAAEAIDTALKFLFDSSTSMADPGTGDVRLNHATPASVTAIAIDDTTAQTGNPDVSAYIASWDDSTDTHKGTLRITKAGTPATFAIYSVTGLTDNAGWTQLAVTYVTGNGTFTNGDTLYLSFSRTGNTGAGSTAAATSFTPAGGIAATDVQAAIEELDSEKQPLDATLTALAGLATGANKIPYSTGTDAFGQLDFKDEDNMASNSATALPSQQSVKAYVDLKANIASPTFTGVPAAPTAAVGTNTTQIATTAFVLANSGAEQYLHVRDEKSTGTGGGDSATSTVTRTLNTVKTNGISGASLATNKITLPAGTYRVRASAPAYSTGSGGDAGHRVTLYNVTDTAIALYGTSEWIDVTTSIGTQTRSFVNGVFTIAGTKDLELRHFINWTETGGQGLAVSDGTAEVYAEVEIWKVG